MDFTTMIVPSRGNDFVALGRTQKGRLFRKHILSKGDLLHPKTGEKIEIDDDFIAKLTKNFQDRVCDIVQVPKAGPNNEHTEDPDRNIGEVVGIQEENGKVYALIDARTDDAEKLGKTLLGASAMMHMNYTDTRTGAKVGPTLLHVAVTNRPYVVELEDYEELVAATAEDTGDTVLLHSAEEPEEIEPELVRYEDLPVAPKVEEEEVAPDPATPAAAAHEEEEEMDLDELLATLKDEHNIDVPALMATAAAAEGATELSNTLAEALTKSGIVQLSNGETITDEDIVGAVAELASTNVALSNRLGSLERDRAAAQVDLLVQEGKILPAQRDTMLELKLSNEDLFTKLVPEEPIVKLSQEEGVTPEPKVQQEQEADIDAEILRYTAQAEKQGYVRS